MYDKLLKTGKVADKDTALQDRLRPYKGHRVDDPWTGAGEAVHVSLCKEKLSLTEYGLYIIIGNTSLPKRRILWTKAVSRTSSSSFNLFIFSCFIRKYSWGLVDMEKAMTLHMKGRVR